MKQATGREWQISPESDNEPAVYMDRGIKIEVAPNAKLEALRAAAEFMLKLYLGADTRHKCETADGGGT